MCYSRKLLHFQNKFKEEDVDHKKYRKVRDNCHYTGKCRSTAHSACNLKYSISKETPVHFHNGSNYDYHFITTEPAKEF